ncbi:MAG: hypothetical protein K6G50_00505 [bacterium]|nr:hypothetical protein [bacterium]
MNFNNISRHLATGVMVGCLTVTLFTACTEKPKTDNGEAPQAVEITETTVVPERAEVATEPSFTFKAGDKEVKGYELKGVDLTGDEDKNHKIRTGAVAAMNDQAFFYVDSEPQISLAKVKINGETISDFEIVSDGYAISELCGNGNVVVFRDKDRNLAIYNGRGDLNKGGECSISDFFGVPGSNEFYYMDGHELKAANLEGTALANERVVIDLEPFENANNLSVELLAVDGDVIYLVSEIEKENGRTPILLAIDKEGKEIRRFEGLEESPRDWAVTNNYVIHSAKTGNFRIYDKASGKLLGDAHADMRPFTMQTINGNDVLVFDDRAHKLYRIDF